MVVAALVLSAGASCSRSRIASQEFTPSPAQAIERRIAAKIESRLPVWLRSWRREVPGLELPSFRRVGDVPITRDVIRPLEAADQPEEKFRLVACSPDGSRCVDP